METHIAGLIDVGQIWQHWKGGEYEIVGIDRAILGIKENEIFSIARIEGLPCSAIAVCDISPGSEMVLYAGQSKKAVYARSRDNFTEILGDTHDPKAGTMFYRFTRLK